VEIRSRQVTHEYTALLRRFDNNLPQIACLRDAWSSIMAGQAKASSNRTRADRSANRKRRRLRRDQRRKASVPWETRMTGCCKPLPASHTEAS